MDNMDQRMFGELQSFGLGKRKPNKEFLVAKGLRQGNPLAPFLFNVIAKGLSGMMREAIKRGLFKSFFVGNKKVEVNLLQYANDTIFLGKSTL